MQGAAGGLLLLGIALLLVSSVAYAEADALGNGAGGALAYQSSFAVNGQRLYYARHDVVNTHYCAWQDGARCKTDHVAGHLIYEVNVKLLTTVQSLKFLTLVVNADDGSGTRTIGRASFSITQSDMPGETMWFGFDTGMTSISGPLNVSVSVVQ